MGLHDTCAGCTRCGVVCVSKKIRHRAQRVMRGRVAKKSLRGAVQFTSLLVLSV